MKNILFIISLYLLFCSCKKTDKELIVINPKSFSPVLKINKVLNDSTIDLTWTKYAGKGFKSYKVYRQCQVLQDGFFVGNYQEIKTLNHPDSLTFTENAMPFARDILYQVVVLSDSGAIGSNDVTYVRPNTYFSLSYNQILTNTDKKYIYLYHTETGSISILNYSNRTELAKVSLNSGIGYCSIGSYDGGIKNEIYVPTVHGWLYILDAETLAAKDKLYIGGERVASVVSIGEKLFVSSSDRSYSTFGPNNTTKVYDRRTKKALSLAGKWDNTRLVRLEGSDGELVGITINIMPADLSFYKYNTDGSLVSQKEDIYHGDHPMSANLVKSFPDGSRIITGSSGTVYTKNLLFEKDLVPIYSNPFSDFEFNADGTIIYSAYGRGIKKIDAISYPSKAVNKTFKTLLNPYKIFRDGNQLICLSMDDSSFRNHGLIEIFNL